MRMLASKKQAKPQQNLRSTIAFTMRKSIRLSTQAPLNNKSGTDPLFFKRKQNKQSCTFIKKSVTSGLRKNAFINHKISYNAQCQAIKKQLEEYAQHNISITSSLDIIISVIGKMSSNLFCYMLFENGSKNIIQIVKRTRSKYFFIRTCLFIGMCCFEYSNLSLTLFYFTRALKALYEKGNFQNFQRKYQILIYKTAAKVYMQNSMFKQAKQMAFKCLRKSWLIKSEDDQFQTYDILGKIYHELNNLILSKYFHYRMCRGVKETIQLIRMSNYQLQMEQKNRQQFFTAEDMNYFVKKDRQFHQILYRHYKSLSNQFFKHQKEEQKQKWAKRSFITHRSPNRVVKNYHTVEKRWLNQNSGSKEIYFIGSKQAKNIKGLHIQFGKLIFNLKSSLNHKRRFVTEMQSQDDFQEFQQFGYKYLRA